MISNKFKKKVSNYWSKQDKKLNALVPNETVFRLLNHSKIILKEKKVLDIGMGDGANLLECKKRGANIFGADIRKKTVIILGLTLFRNVYLFYMNWQYIDSFSLRCMIFVISFVFALN